MELHRRCVTGATLLKDKNKLRPLSYYFQSQAKFLKNLKTQATHLLFTQLLFKICFIKLYFMRVIKCVSKPCPQCK